jgi:hypothetical protein
VTLTRPGNALVILHICHKKTFLPLLVWLIWTIMGPYSK